MQVKKTCVVGTVCHQPARHLVRQALPAPHRHLAPRVQVAAGAVVRGGVGVVGQRFAVEGIHACVAGLQHPLPLRVDEAPGLAVGRHRCHGLFVEAVRLRKARRHHPLAPVVHIAPQRQVAVGVPGLGRGQPHRAKVAQVGKRGGAGELALQVDDAPGMRPCLDGSQAVAQGACLVKLRRNHFLAQQVEVAPAASPAKAGHAVFGEAARVVQRGRHQPLALFVDVAPAPVVRLRRADEAAVRRALKLHHLAQRGLGRDGAVGMHDEQRVRLAVRVQRDLGQAGRCRGGLGHRVGVLRAAS